MSLTLLVGCATSKKYLQEGKYDMAIQKSVKKIRKKPTNEKQVAVLDKAFKLANDKDMERINFLKRDGSPDIWEEVFDRYSRMKDRQALVKTVLPLSLEGRTINYKIVDYDLEIIEAKKRAAEYYYAHGMKLMEKKDKASAREAYYDFVRVKEFYHDYQDVDKYINEAHYAGTNRVHLKVQNQSMIKIPKEMADKLLNVDYERLNTLWVEYYIEDRPVDFFDYEIAIQLKKIDLAPEQIVEEQNIETKEIEDGWDYYLDDKGNVMKDTAGNDIKKPKYKTISCKVIQSHQTKVVHIEGQVEYVQLINNKVVKVTPIAADNVFKHTSATAIGDLNALKPESKKIIGIKPLPFPADIDMMMQAAETLRRSIHDALRANTHMIQ